MSLKQTAEIWLKSVVSNHVGKNIRRYSWATYLGEVRHNSLGGITYLLPREGKVVDINDQFTLVKTGATEFRVISNELLSQAVNVGDKIGLSFYKLKRFDGTAADGSEDPSDGGVRSIMLTGASTKFPVKWEDRYLGINERFADSYTVIQNPYLRDLIRQMENIPVNDGLRNVVNVLVDAGATDLAFNDPPEELSAESAPAIKVRVNTSKHVGLVEISYNRVPDTYTVKLTPDGEGQSLVLENLYFDMLGDALVDGIDDGQWKLAKVVMIKPAPKQRAGKQELTT